jgi:imidazole glycerol-phosphate synthase subunit HisH
MKKISIMDYGLGNTRSLFNSIKKVKHNVTLYSENKKNDFDILFIPGVGSFAKAVELLNKNNFYKIINQAKKEKKIIVGICLGMHLLFGKGTEHGTNAGLNFIEGSVHILNKEKNFKLPNIGWKKVQFTNNCEHDFLKKFNDCKFYFIHSYAARPKNDKNIYAYTKYNNTDFVSVAGNENILGMQFHPEKSADNGLELIKNIINFF